MPIAISVPYQRSLYDAISKISGSEGLGIESSGGEDQRVRLATTSRARRDAEGGRPGAAVDGLERQPGGGAQRRRSRSRSRPRRETHGALGGAVGAQLAHVLAGPACAPGRTTGAGRCRRDAPRERRCGDESAWMGRDPVAVLQLEQQHALPGRELSRGRSRAPHVVGRGEEPNDVYQESATSTPVTCSCAARGCRPRRARSRCRTGPRDRGQRRAWRPSSRVPSRGGRARTARPRCGRHRSPRSTIRAGFGAPCCASTASIPSTSRAVRSRRHAAGPQVAVRLVEEVAPPVAHARKRSLRPFSRVR